MLLNTVLSHHVNLVFYGRQFCFGIHVSVFWSRIAEYKYRTTFLQIFLCAHAILHLLCGYYRAMLSACVFACISSKPTIMYLQDQLVEPEFVALLGEIEASRELKVIYGQVTNICGQCS